MYVLCRTLSINKAGKISKPLQYKDILLHKQAKRQLKVYMTVIMFTKECLVKTKLYNIINITTHLHIKENIYVSTTSSHDSHCCINNYLKWSQSSQLLAKLFQNYVYSAGVFIKRPDFPLLFWVFSSQLIFLKLCLFYNTQVANLLPILKEFPPPQKLDETPHSD